jgi:hypothetical protein
VFGERLPVGSPVIVALAPDAVRLPLAGGTLCLDPSSLTIAPEVLVADARGKVLLPLVRGAQAVTLFPPGTTWHVQLLYRDGHDLTLSDAVRVTFAD